MARRDARDNTARDKPSGGSETQAKDVCLRLLSDRARSRSELEQSLAKKGYTADIAESALDRLAQVGLIDDAAFAEQWVHSRHTFSGKGRQALALELRRKGVGKEEAAGALEQISADDERERAAELVRKKLRTLSVPDDTGERDKTVRKLVGMLARRGYGQGMAFDVVKTALAQIGSATDDLVDE
ncbi:recombination regulator RecX [Antrihabitans cavernicola]|uniref:Regulatory protein RecX n=1 Tax=Antrihabitans cavernicola TaxID=2495913 RepID=A0A5A7SF67_9NOCA|nr:recombination regulator RecX [Spelaeibacter cavernicola]KAA0023337.1 recombination regulator RecX [Spelaeibacter cavernicola]